MDESVNSVTEVAELNDAADAGAELNDSAAVYVRPFMPGFADTLYSRDYRPVSTPFDNVRVEMRPLLKGMEGEALPYNTVYDSSLFVLVFSALALVLAFLSKGRILLGQIFARNMRGRDRNIRSTVNEWRLGSALVFLSIVMTGLTLVYFMRMNGDTNFSGMPFLYVAVACGGVAAVMMFQQCVAAVVGEVFFRGREDADLARRNFSYYVIPGVLLTLPVLAMLYSSGWADGAVYLALSLLALSRIVFLCSTFKIFLHNIYSLFYIILYFCAVEIIPLVVLYYGVAKIFVFL